MELNLDNLDLFFNQEPQFTNNFRDEERFTSGRMAALDLPRPAPVWNKLHLSPTLTAGPQSQLASSPVFSVQGFKSPGFKRARDEDFPAGGLSQCPSGKSPRIGIVAPSPIVGSSRVSIPAFKVPLRPPGHPGDSYDHLRPSPAPPAQAHQWSARASGHASNKDGLVSTQTPHMQYRSDDARNQDGDASVGLNVPEEWDHGTGTPRALTLSVQRGGVPTSQQSQFFHLKSVQEIPDNYRGIFPFPYFNVVQSKVFDEVLYTDKSIVLCAPTGSGKTVVFELAIVRLLIQQHGRIADFKVVYMAPIKALCSERYEDWKEKFGPLGLKCYELTGDTEFDDHFALQDVHIILTTPEKWDSKTRMWRDNKSLIQLVRLFFIDETHTLNDDTRGATMEVVVSRMKTVQASVGRSGSAGDPAAKSSIRFVAVSATVPNVEDIAQWLQITDKSGAAHFKVDASMRPVRLRQVVLGYPCSENTSEFRFDLTLNYKLASVIDTYSEHKPSLVFCATRKGAAQAASTLAKDARFILNDQHKKRLQKFSHSIKDSKLRDLVLQGVGYHHAGLDLHDRKLVESAFAHADLPVLMCTSTLSMGVNLPAHLVVIKSTQHYVSGCHEEYSETQILQMIGRAGRPQFDTTATAVIMTKASTKRKYESLVNATRLIESSLHKHLVEHLNAEIVLGTITDVSVAMEWIKSTLLYIRVLKNPKHYGIPVGLTKDEVEDKLQDMCLKNLQSLASYQLLQMEEDGLGLLSTETGKLMARYCIAFETIKNFHSVVGTESISELLDIVCQSREFQDVQLRVAEKKTLNTLNHDNHRATVRFEIKGKIKSAEMKVNCLFQTAMGTLPLQDFSLQQDTTKIFRAGPRVTRCLVEMLWLRPLHFKALLHAVLLAKCFRAKLWENSKHLSRQLTGIGPSLSNALVNAGITTFQKIEETNPRDLEMIVNRHPPFGSQMKDSVSRLPKYELFIDQSTAYGTDKAELSIKVDISNKQQIQDKSTTDRRHTSTLIVGDADNRVVFKARISDAQLLRSGPWTTKLAVRRAQKGDELSVNLISQEWAGLDVQSSYTPVYTGPKRLSHTTEPQPSPQGQGQAAPRGQGQAAPNGAEEREWNESHKPCSHRCHNKQTCAHDCCKHGVPLKRSGTKESAMEKYRRDLKGKVDCLQPTPNIKHLPRTVGRQGIQQYAYCGSVKGRMSIPVTPQTVQNPRENTSDWGQLNFYQQHHRSFLQDELQEQDIQQGAEDDFTEEHRDPDDVARNRDVGESSSMEPGYIVEDFQSTGAAVVYRGSKVHDLVHCSSPCEPEASFELLDNGDLVEQEEQQEEAGGVDDNWLPDLGEDEIRALRGCDTATPTRYPTLAFRRPSNTGTPAPTTATSAHPLRTPADVHPRQVLPQPGSHRPCLMGQELGCYGSTDRPDSQPGTYRPRLKGQKVDCYGSTNRPEFLKVQEVDCYGSTNRPEFLKGQEVDCYGSTNRPEFQKGQEVDCYGSTNRPEFLKGQEVDCYGSTNRPEFLKGQKVGCYGSTNRPESQPGTHRPHLKGQELNCYGSTNRPDCRAGRGRAPLSSSGVGGATNVQSQSHGDWSQNLAHGGHGLVCPTDRASMQTHADSQWSHTSHSQSNAFKQQQDSSPIVIEDESDSSALVPKYNPDEPSDEELCIGMDADSSSGAAPQHQGSKLGASACWQGYKAVSSEAATSVPREARTSQFHQAQHHSNRQELDEVNGAYLDIFAGIF